MAKEKFIKKAIKKPGSLRETVRRLKGKCGFTERGTDNTSE